MMVRLEGTVEFGNFRKNSIRFTKSGYRKLSNLFLILRVLHRYLTIKTVKYLITTGIYRIVIDIFGKENNPNAEFTKKPIIADLSINLLVEYTILNEMML